MVSMRRSYRPAPLGVFVSGMLFLAAPAFSQVTAPPTNGIVAVGGEVSVASTYVFRGVRQNSTGVAIWPTIGVSVRALADRGPFERITIDGGFWNSLNTGDTGANGPASEAWYESRLSAGLTFALRGGVSVATSFTSYASPNDLFTTAKEFGLRIGIDDEATGWRAALHPYAQLAFEVDADIGAGQLDGGLHAGRYLELGVRPGYAGRRFRVTAPVRVGLSLGDYYELGTRDNRFGFVSGGAVVSIPIGGAPASRGLSVRAGVEVYRLGETTRVFNGGDRVASAATIGLAIGR